MKNPYITIETIVRQPVLVDDIKPLEVEVKRSPILTYEVYVEPKGVNEVDAFLDLLNYIPRESPTKNGRMGNPYM